MKKGTKNMNKINTHFKEHWAYYKKEFKQSFNDLKHKETFYKQIPNLLTASRAIGIIPVNILFLTGNIVPATILLGALLSTDFFDGKIARKYGIVTKFGADLDAICDKIMAIGLIVPLLFDNWLLYINLLLEAIIAIVNVSGRLKGIDTKTIYSGKVKTWFLSITLGMGYLTKFISICQPIFSLFSIITAGAQLKTSYDYIAHQPKQTTNEIEKKEVSPQIEQTKTKREQQLLELQKEKEFLLSSQREQEPKEDVKTKKRTK